MPKKTVWTPDGDYEVGYCKPPQATQFQKGVSGNPLGRPKKPVTSHEHIEAIFAEKVKVHVNGKTKIMTRREAMIRKWISEGNRPFISILMNRERDRAEEQMAREGEQQKRNAETDLQLKETFDKIRRRKEKIEAEHALQTQLDRYYPE